MTIMMGKPEGERLDDLTPEERHAMMVKIMDEAARAIR